MTSDALRRSATFRPRQLRRGLCALALSLLGCAVKAPPEPRPLDCETLDRAAERFPEECGEADQDASASDASEAADGAADAGEPFAAGEPFDAGELFDALP